MQTGLISFFMHSTGYNEWDFYPINLNLKEANNPILVLDNFFADDWLSSQMERLKVWRDYVLKDVYFLDNKNSPYGLLNFYKHNICLIEAAHLLKEAGAGIAIVNDQAELQREKKMWRDYPANLTEEELLNPNLVIDEFFKYYNLPQYRRYLYDWLEYGLSAKTANEFIETADLIRVYENLLKLYPAAWLIHQRSTNQPYLKANKQLIADHSIEVTAYPVSPVSLYQLANVIQISFEDNLSKLCAMIRHKVSTVQAIFYLGASPDNAETIFLLILTGNDETRQAQALSSMIEESCLSIAPVVALVHHASNLFTAVKYGSRFFCNALTCPVIYLSGELILPTFKVIARHHSDEDLALWNRWYSQGKEFLSGADYYLKINAFGPALFSLHQCAECLLIALIREILDYRINNHNLSKLLSISEMFTMDLIKVFDLDDPDSAALLDHLKHAYVNVRYKDIYEPDGDAVISLYQTLKRFVEITESLYQKHLAVSNL